MANNRIYFPVEAVGFSPHGQAWIPASGAAEEPSGFIAAHGVQSAAANTTFNLEQVFELGQLELYENIEGIPNIEVTMQKVLDGYPLLYHLATQKAVSATLVGRSNERCFVAFNIYTDTQENASGMPIQAVGMSGMYPSAITYTLNVDGNSTEDLTLVGNDKYWKGANGFADFLPNFNGTDAPLAITGSGGVQRREDVLMGETENSSLWPTDIPGITASGTNPVSGDGFAAHIQTVTVSANLGRTELFELGIKKPYFRYVNFPLEVTTAINVTASEGDNVDAIADPVGGSNLTDQRIRINMREGTVIDLGAKNKLASINFTLGDTGGGVGTVVYNYSNFNSLKVTHPQDPAKVS